MVKRKRELVTVRAIAINIILNKGIVKRMS
jgi:hypothetical protein